MEEFQNKIKSFPELLYYVFIDFLKNKKTILSLLSAVLLIEMFILFLINRVWFLDYLMKEDYVFLGIDKILIMLSFVIFLFAFSLKISIITCLREELKEIRTTLKESLKSSFKLLIIIILVGGIILEFFFLLDSFKIIIILTGLLFLFWIAGASYISLKEKREGTESFIKTLHIFKKNYFIIASRLLFFSIVLFLASVAVAFPFILFFIFIPISNVLSLIFGLILFFVFFLIFFTFIGLYLSILFENAFKIKKHIAFPSPMPLYIFAINIFILIIFFILILTSFAMK